MGGSHVKISALVQTYNEADRITQFMGHAIKWADEVVVVDKTSPDGTAEIARSLGARVLTIPYSPNGSGDYAGLFAACQNDWVWFFTAGEIPTRKLVEEVRAMVDDAPENIALIIIPKKLYSFGIHDTRSPWSISGQPFVVNRKRAKIQNTIHCNFSGPAMQIQYAQDCYVLHPTHPSVEAFFSSHMDYIRKEMQDAADPRARIRTAAAFLSYFDFGHPVPESDLFGQMCAWQFYHYGVMLACWEKMRGYTADRMYRDMRTTMLGEQWEN